jgi:hypothetical protein
MSAAASVAPPVPAAATTSRRRRLPGRRTLLLVLVAIVSAGAALLATTLLHRTSQPALVPGQPAIVAPGGVAAAAKQAGHPIYGAGTQPGTRLELTLGSHAETWVRYLSAGTAAGDRRPGYLTVGTYRQAGALAAAQQAAKGARMKSAPLPGGGLMLYSLDRPTSVYLARPGSDLLIEVYSPDAAQAQGLARGGAVVPLP